jgi:glycine betaine/choline ABC-type transport system substrate-binding protein
LRFAREIRCPAVAGLTSATDGAAWAAGQRPLVDDLGVFPAFVVAPVLDAETAIRRPEVATALQPLTAGLTTALLGGWNARVVAGESPASVAADAVAVLRGDDASG